ncbi:MAG: hypothetical protein QOJ96_1109 [Alphaproteobacteria bacterium]|jgi:hypothetical protein|nr:hypothetical protein [Alphaproteobacteria bacterium]
MDRVVAFPSRASLRREGQRRVGLADTQRQPGIASLAKYEHTEETDDYRHRMIINVIAFVFIAMLTGAGVWLADALSTMRKNPDCLMSSRRSCGGPGTHTIDR